MSAFFAGIDGGQTSTVAEIGDAFGALGRGNGPPAALVGEARDSGRDAAALDASLAAALAAARLDPATRLTGIVAGISGFDAGVSRKPPFDARGARVRVVHDTEIAHAGALAGAAGIVVIAGTGSVALGNETPGGAFVRAGGWGSIFGDGGSAFWIARTAVHEAMRRFDRDEPCALGERALAFFGLSSLRELQHAVAHGEVARSRLASFASEALAAAASGDRDALAIRGAAARELADLVAIVDRRLEPAPWRLVSFAGGCFGDARFLDAFAMALLDAVPHAHLMPPQLDPAGGALVLARALA